MSAAAGATGESPVASKLGLTSGQIVQELGWDEDVDEELRVAVEDAIDGELVEEAVEAVDVVLLWWRVEDGDLVDGLVDSLTDLTDTGYIWLMTPKVGRPGYVDASDLSEAAITAGLAQTVSVAVIAGLAQTVSVAVSSDWSATKLVRPRGTRR